MRLFVAVELEDPQRESARRVSESLRTALGANAKGFSFGRPETFHFTLKFLGEVEPARLVDVEDATRTAAAAHAPFSLALGAPGAFPTVRHPRVAWIGLSEGQEPLSALAGDLDAALARAGFEPEKRPFRAHLTLARARERRGGPSLEQVFETLSGGSAPMTVRELVVFESRLSPKGAQHTALVRAPLGG